MVGRPASSKKVCCQSEIGSSISTDGIVKLWNRVEIVCVSVCVCVYLQFLTPKHELATACADAIPPLNDYSGKGVTKKIGESGDTESCPVTGAEPDPQSTQRGAIVLRPRKYVDTHEGTSGQEAFPTLFNKIIKLSLWLGFS